MKWNERDLDSFFSLIKDNINYYIYGSQKKFIKFLSKEFPLRSISQLNFQFYEVFKRHKKCINFDKQKKSDLSQEQVSLLFRFFKQTDEIVVNLPENKNAKKNMAWRPNEIRLLVTVLSGLVQEIRKFGMDHVIDRLLMIDHRLNDFNRKEIHSAVERLRLAYTREYSSYKNSTDPMQLSIYNQLHDIFQSVKSNKSLVKSEPSPSLASVTYAAWSKEERDTMFTLMKTSAPQSAYKFSKSIASELPERSVTGIYRKVTTVINEYKDKPSASSDPDKLIEFEIVHQFMKNKKRKSLNSSNNFASKILDNAPNNAAFESLEADTNFSDSEKDSFTDVKTESNFDDLTNRPLMKIFIDSAFARLQAESLFITKKKELMYERKRKLFSERKKIRAETASINSEMALYDGWS